MKDLVFEESEVVGSMFGVLAYNRWLVGDVQSRKVITSGFLRLLPTATILLRRSHDLHTVPYHVDMLDLDFLIYF